MLTPEQKKLIYVQFEGSDGESSAVIFNGVTVYYEDEDCSNPNFSAQEVAERLEDTTKLKYLPVRLASADLPEEWNFDDVLEAALRKANEQ